MPSAEEIADTLLSAPAGTIAAINLMVGARIGLYSKRFASSVCWRWGEHVRQMGKQGSAIAFALNGVRDPDQGTPAAVSLGAGATARPEGLHIKCRRKDPRTPRVRRATVREAAQLLHWGNLEDLERLGDLGIAVNAGPGDPSYERTMQALRSLDFTFTIKVSNEDDKYFSNPVILFYTKAADLKKIWMPESFELRADAVRDALGLIHLANEKPVLIIEFDGALAEDRDDCGRPTVIDSGGGTRFLSGIEVRRSRAVWGRTVHLGKSNLEEAVRAGLPERVSGPTPNPTGRRPRGLSVTVRFLGTPKLPRRDLLGVGDDAFAERLARRFERKTGNRPREALIALLETR